MKILQKSAGLLTNREVLQVLHEKGAAEQEVRLALPSERKVYEHLRRLDGSHAVPSVERFRDGLRDKGLDLTDAEVVQLVNLQPKLLVEVVLAVDQCEQRMKEDDMQTVIDAVEHTFTPSTANPQSQYIAR